MKGSVRGVDSHRNGTEEDPFAELADIFESELGRDAFRAEPVAHGALAEEFEPVIAADLAPSLASPAALSPAERHRQGAADASYQSWLAPRGSRMSVPVDPSSRPLQAGSHQRPTTGRAPGDAPETDFETAIRGLSAPANPRDTIVVETQSFAPERVEEHDHHEPAPRELDDFDELIASELAVMNEHAAAGHGRGGGTAAGQGYYAQSQPADSFASSADDRFDDAHDDDDRSFAARRPFLARNAKALAAGVMALALIGAVGGFMAGGSSSDVALAGSEEPLLIKADAEPYKVVPKDPGGRSIPNQNKAVYERVASPNAATGPTQQALLTESEEPMDLPAEEEPSSYEDLPGVDLVDNEGLGLKDEGRIEDVLLAESDAAPIPVLQPRKVRTMVVRPDGTIVPAAASVAAPLRTAAAGTATLPISTPLVPTTPNGAPALIEASSSIPPQAMPGATVPYSAALVAEPVANAPRPEATAEVQAPEPASETMQPDSIEVAAIAPQTRAAPAAAVAAPEVAAATPAAPPPTGAYFVQISSQPSEVLAQQSLKSLGSRYADMIEGRSIGIQSADIPGKGTFYRVRVATASKDEAASLCNRLKSAGGNCFVAR